MILVLETSSLLKTAVYYFMKCKFNTQHSLIAKVVKAQDYVTGDGTISNVLIIGELLKQADRHISKGLHPRIITESFETAKEKVLQVLEQIREMDRKTNRCGQNISTN